MKAQNPDRNWKNHWLHFLAFGLGSGAAKKAPGTFGTLAAIPFYLLMATFFSIEIYAVFIVFAFILGVYLCNKASLDMGVHDHGGIVWDEFVGFWITMLAIPFSWQQLDLSVVNLVLGFGLFRFFDIIKPWPIKWLDQKVHGGFGIMIDDVIAGLFAWIILYSMNVTLFTGWF